VRTPTTPDLGVYVHVPFCERVCPYCDFAVEATPLDGSLEDAFVDLLLRELDLAREAFPEELARPLASVYLGGGTPSLLGPRSVERILVALEDAFNVADEVTLELNPGHVEIEGVPGFRDAGVTRVSVGVQSLHDHVLKRLGRAHKADDARRGLEACLKAGFPSLSADLIWGAPGQTLEELMADVDWLLRARVPHVSAYALTIEPGTPFARAKKLATPDEDTTLRMYKLLRGALRAGGLEQYEISSFSRLRHRSRHNQRYWRRQSVLGLGPSAASLLGDTRFQNLRARPDWAAALQGGELPLLEPPERLDLAEIRRETLWLGLRRLQGVSRAEWLRRFGEPPESAFPAELGDLKGLGLVEDRAGHLRLTERGILFADDVLLRFAGR
jgi:oxygen-independent coproporphyrinogen-3 oxidase